MGTGRLEGRMTIEGSSVDLEPSRLQVTSPEPSGSFRYQASSYCLLKQMCMSTIPEIFPHLSMTCRSPAASRQHICQAETRQLRTWRDSALDPTYHVLQPVCQELLEAILLTGQPPVQTKGVCS